MIFTSDFLFIHVPKTGGMAMTDFLLRALPKPVYYSHPHDPDAKLTAQGIVEIPGDRHESAALCREVMARHGFDLTQLKLIIAVVRNPYELEISRFAYLQNAHEWDRGLNQQLALSGDFEAFARESEDHGGADRPIESYFELGGARLNNLHVLHQENLAAELHAALATIGITASLELPRVNTTRHGDWREYYTPGAEAAVYQRYRWIFDQGFYPRLDANTFTFAAPGPRFMDKLPLSGPLQRLRLASGYWLDNWVTSPLRFPVRITRPVRGVRLAGWTPRHTSTPVELVLKLGARTFRQSLPGDQAFDFEIPCPLAPHEAIEVELAGAPTFKPTELTKDSADTRELAFRLTRFEFQPVTPP